MYQLLSNIVEELTMLLPKQPQLFCQWAEWDGTLRSHGVSNGVHYAWHGPCPTPQRHEQLANKVAMVQLNTPKWGVSPHVLGVQSAD